MSDWIDMRPLRTQPEARNIMLLARGQLNRAFRAHGLQPPDALTPADPAGIAAEALDDPASAGIEKAMSRFGAAFSIWADRLPTILVLPLLDVLLQAWRAECRDDAIDPVGPALMTACGFLLGQASPKAATLSRAGDLRHAAL